MVVGGMGLLSCKMLRVAGGPGGSCMLLAKGEKETAYL